MFGAFVLSEPSDLTGLGACCSTEGKTLLAHIQGPLLSAEIFVHHGQIISQQFSVKMTIP